MVVEFLYHLVQVMIINMEKIKDLFEAYGIAVGIIIETTGCFLSSIGQTIIDRFQPPSFPTYEQPTTKAQSLSDDEKWVLKMGELEDIVGCSPAAGHLAKKHVVPPQTEDDFCHSCHEDLGLSSPDPFNLRGICLGGDQPGLASEIAYLKRKRNGKN